MKITRKLLSAVLVVALLSAATLTAFAAEVSWGPKTIYLDGKDDSWGWHSISIEHAKSAKLTDVKSSNAKIIGIGSIEHWQSEYIYFDDDDTPHESAYYDSSIGITAKKKGTAKVSFKLNGKSYEHEYTVVDYVNPVKSFVLTGVSKTNLKARFDKRSYASGKLSANAKAGYMTVSAASGWKINSANWSMEDGSDRSFYSNKGVSSVKLIVDALDKKDVCRFYVNFINVKTGATQSVTYELGVSD